MKKNIVPTIFALCFLLLSIDVASGQPYPVTVTFNVIPPAGVSLAEYQVSPTPKVMASIVLTDLQKPVFKVRLKLTIAGNGLLLTTSDQAVLPPVDLLAGQAVTLDQTALAGYFDISTLNITGMNRNEFIRRGQILPEGTYSFCLEAYDYNRPQGLPVSNTGCSIAQVERYDPPILNPPDFTNTILFDMQPPGFQQGLFTWQPMHTGIFPVEYNLRIYKKDGGMESLPDKMILEATPPYISIRTKELLYHLQPTDPPLMPDVQYYGVVQVIPLNYPAIFKNNGNSEKVSFVINPEEKSPCEKPQEYRGAGQRPGIALDWKTYRACEGFVTEYYDLADEQRKYQDAEIETGDALTDTIRAVVSEHTYILRTGCICLQDTLYTDTIRVHFKRPKATVPPFSCGSDGGAIAGIPSYLPVLNPDDTIVAADLRVIIRKATGGNGRFSGKGHIEMPYFKYARINVNFTDITVNDEYRMTDGELEVVGVGQNVIGDDALGAIMTILEGMDEWSDILGEAAAILDMLDQLLLQMAENMPPWLIQEILAIKGMIANPPEGANIDELMARLKELEGERKVWERLYWEIIIATIERINEDYETNRQQIDENFNTSYNTISPNVIFIQENDIENDPPIDDGLIAEFYADVISSDSITYTIEEYAELNQNIGTNIVTYFSAKKEANIMEIINKLELELNADFMKVPLFTGLLLKVGKNVISSIKQEFESRNWDLSIIESEEAQIVDKCKAFMIQSIVELYINLN
ncbi:MAG: hypothetical protein KDC31_07135 [Saprospiraceae bacterium]|nr:MAG: fibronectin type III domain-containing protein [Candidatus Parvibacillus calidus]MBX2938016.1 hypothetical protein [Saprospiraceae bacterium]MBK7742107.1 hypothetical protein [Candidatus Parvibacillus calidus]MBX7179391.1 hypothetical protein [Saprospiraceae bacterium]MCB0591047.1 hypothetical protein [Saprospiraceae bacterium]